ncbi:MAG: hypothetical protein ABI615_10405 [Chthoniobacterales bacterium]
MQDANLSFWQARLLAFLGMPIRRYNWTDHWLVYYRYLWWLRGPDGDTQIVLNTFFGDQEFLGFDWTTRGSIQICNPAPPPPDQPPSDTTPPPTSTPPGRGVIFNLSDRSTAWLPTSLYPAGFLDAPRVWNTYSFTNPFPNNMEVTLRGTSNNAIAVGTNNSTYSFQMRTINGPERSNNPVDYTFLVLEGRAWSVLVVNSTDLFAGFDLEGELKVIPK